MHSFFKKKGPFDINYLLKKTIYTNKKPYKKFKVKNISSLDDSEKGDLTFLENKKYLSFLQKTKASFCLINKQNAKYLNKNTIPIISENPLLDFILIAKLFYPDADNDHCTFSQNKKFKKFLKQNTYVDSTVKIGKKFKIGFNSLLKKNIKIGNNVRIGSNCVISNSIIEDNVIINDGTVIGKIGYGFKYIDSKLNFIPHLGQVHIKNNVYIGSNCTIDRGSFSNTIIDHNTMIDNLVHIAHNVKIGTYCFIAGQVGIAGSTIIGNNCMIGGQTGVSGHLKVGNNVHIGGHSGVIKNVKDNEKIMGYPATNIRTFLKRSNSNDR